MESSGKIKWMWWGGEQKKKKGTSETLKRMKGSQVGGVMAAGRNDVSVAVAALALSRRTWSEKSTVKRERQEKVHSPVKAMKSCLLQRCLTSLIRMLNSKVDCLEKWLI